MLFYGYWIPECTLLLLGSICGNFAIGRHIARQIDARHSVPKSKPKLWLVFGIGANLALLAYFKYASFFLANLNLSIGSQWNLGNIVLPIGISFFTFTQIAFLADAYQKGAREFDFLHYGLFVTYFPHLIAGPVLHHSQMMPQFADPSTYRFNAGNCSAGLAIFALGLAKKVVLADGISPYADAIFEPADAGLIPTTREAWLGAVAYTLQLYFDFSGYSDMAVGLSWMFNVRLPFNFGSPYRAVNISEFWRRWHISLSTFLRDYLYISLGGNRRGSARRYLNLAITMVLGGLWHGASWSFVVWGSLHGAYLVLHQGFRAACGPTVASRLDRSQILRVLSWAFTMLLVVVAWVFFRATSFSGAMRILQSMAGASPSPALDPLLWNAGLQLSTAVSWCCVLGLFACLPYNTNRIGVALLASAQRYSQGIVTLAAAAFSTVLFLVLVNATRSAVSTFIYFNF